MTKPTNWTKAFDDRFSDYEGVLWDWKKDQPAEPVSIKRFISRIVAATRQQYYQEMIENKDET